LQQSRSEQLRKTWVQIIADLNNSVTVERNDTVDNPSDVSVEKRFQAQELENICGEYTYHAPENVTLEQAKQTALERAKSKALAEKFGTIYRHQKTSVEKDENGKNERVTTDWNESEVKGEWIANTQEPKYMVSMGTDGFTVKVSVCGVAREIVGMHIDFQAKTLRNGTEIRDESEQFRHGDDIYLSFRSPVDGYLAVYLIDDKTAFCLLPYPKDPTGKTRIKAGKNYLFFSKEHAATEEKAIVKEYIMTCEKSTEQNFLYVIFSPNEFTKANDNDFQGKSDYKLPRELPLEEFQKWLAKNRQRDKDMKHEIKVVTIQK
jgi:hypothetical protein